MINVSCCGNYHCVPIRLKYVIVFLGIIGRNQQLKPEAYRAWNSYARLPSKEY